MSFSLATSRAWRTAIVALAAVALFATLIVLGSTPERASAQDATTCYAVADSNAPGNLNAEGEVDTLIRIQNALVAPIVQVIGGNGGLGTGDTEAMAIRPLPDGSFQMHGWESSLNLFSIDPDTAATSGGPFSIPGKVEGLTWSGTDDNDAANDLLWATFGNPANQVSAYSATGQLVAGPITVEVGDRNSLVDLAWDQVTDQVFAIITNETDVTDLITINPANGVAAVVGPTSVDMEGLGFGRNGQLVGTTGNDGENAFHLVDKSNGVAPVQSNLSAITGAFDFESVDCVRDSGDPVEPPPPLPDLNSVCYAISDSITAAVADENSPDTLVRIDTAAGTASIVGQVDGGATVSVEAFAIRPGVGLYGFDPDTGGGRLFLIDETNASITAIASGLAALGDVDGMTFSGIADDDASNDVLWMSIRNVGAPSDQLVSVDAATGDILSGPVNIDASGVPGVTVNDIDDIAWDPVTGQVFGTAGSGEANSLVAINPASGAVTNVGSFGVNDIEGLGFSNTGVDNGFLFGTTGKEDGDSASALYLINTADPTASQQVIDLNGVTGVTDFESVDCLALAGPPLVDDGEITASLIAECIGNSGKISVTVAHTAGGPVDYTVAIAGQPDVAGVIADGDADAMIMTDPNLANGDYVVSVVNESTQTVVLNETAPIECLVDAVLGATVDGTCQDGAGKITVMLEYVSGNAPGEFVVSVTGQPDQSVILTEPDTEMVMYSGLTDALYDIIVTGNDQVIASVQRNVLCGAAGIEIQLSANGDDADNPTGPVIEVGGPVTFEYKVTNTGEVPLTNVQVNDAVLGAISCPQAELGAGEMMICSITGEAQPGQYSSTASVSGTPPAGPDVVGEDPTNYLGALIAIDLVLSVDGEDANEPPGPVIVVGEQVELTYEVTNTGNVPLTNVVVEDATIGVIECPATTLEPGASVLCVVNELATAGAQVQTGNVTADGPNGAVASASDPANYFGEGSGLTLMMTVNGDDGLTVAIGAPIVIEYKITNIGNTAVSQLAIIDDDLGPITCDVVELLPGEMGTCIVEGVAAAGQVDLNSSVAGISETGSTVTASDPSSYNGASSVIGDFVWVDLNQNCSQDAGEPGVGGIDVNLWIDTDGDGTPDNQISSTVTDANGQYIFNITDAAEYVVQFGAPAGSYTCMTGGDEASDSDVNGDSGITDAFSVAAGGSTMDVDAGLLPAALGDTVFLDENADGVQSAGEPGVSGIVVNLWEDTDGDGEPNNQLSSTTTDANGGYSFEGLDPQVVYIVQFITDGRAFTASGAGADPATDSNAGIGGITGPINLSFGETNPTIDAGLLNVMPGQISGVVFDDQDANDQAAAAEGLAGITVVLTDAAGVEVATASTGVDGGYLFENVAPGDYTVTIGTRPANLIPTFDSETAAGQDPDELSPVSLVEGELKSGVDFGYQACASINGLVFSDANANGTQDAAEIGFAGVTINLWIVDAGGSPAELVATTTSNSAGDYDFTCIDPTESYVIAVVGQTLTTPNVGDDDAIDSDVDPNSGISGVINLDPGEQDDSVDVGILGGAGSIAIETLTNGVDADEPGSGPEVGVGSMVIWTYEVTNTGTVSLSNVTVDDSVLGNAVCFFEALDPGETQSCSQSAVATLSDAEYSNVGSVIGSPAGGGPAVVAEDPSHHTVVAGEVASISITTITTIGANSGDNVTGTAGATATIEYIVMNTGNVALSNIEVTDSTNLAVTCPGTELAAQASFVCSAQVAVAVGAYENVGSVTAVGPDGATVVDASDPTSHRGVPAGPAVILPPAASTGSSTGHIVTVSTGTTAISPNFTPPNPSASFTASGGTAAEAEPLAMTGSNSMDLALIAGGAIVAGAAFVALSRRRERAEA